MFNRESQLVYAEWNPDRCSGRCGINEHATNMGEFMDNKF